MTLCLGVQVSPLLPRAQVARRQWQGFPRPLPASLDLSLEQSRRLVRSCSQQFGKPLFERTIHGGFPLIDEQQPTVPPHVFVLVSTCRTTLVSPPAPRVSPVGRLGLPLWAVLPTHHMQPVRNYVEVISQNVEFADALVSQVHLLLHERYATKSMACLQGAV